MRRFARKLAEQWVADNCPAAAAAIAFYTIFSLAPTLVFAIAIASEMLGDASSHSAAISWLGSVLGPQQAEELVNLLRATNFKRHGLLPTAAGGVVLLWGASAVFAQLRTTLNRIFGCAVEDWRERLRLTAIGRLLAAAFAVAVGLALIAGMAASTLVSYVLADANYLMKFTTHGILWFAVGVALLRVLPARSPPWRHAIPSAVVSTALFEVGKYLIAAYLARSLIASAYGPSSAIVAILLWTYYSAQTFLIGAEICKYRMQRNGKHAT
jgi:membrane protein